MSKKKFPELLYVVQEQDGGDTFYVPHRVVYDISTEHDGEKVAVYTLDHVKTLKVEKDLV